MAETIVEIRDANIYQGDNLVLQNVNLQVDKGEFVYLVGKTGTGKSSLLKTLYGELPLKPMPSLCFVLHREFDRTPLGEKLCIPADVTSLVLQDATRCKVGEPVLDHR